MNSTHTHTLNKCHQPPNSSPFIHLVLHLSSHQKFPSDSTVHCPSLHLHLLVNLIGIFSQYMAVGTPLDWWLSQMWPSHQSGSAWLYVGPAVLWDNMTSALRGKREGREGRRERGVEKMEERGDERGDERTWREDGGKREGREGRRESGEKKMEERGDERAWREDGGERGQERVEGRRWRRDGMREGRREREGGLKGESVLGRERKTNVCDFMCHIWRLLCRYNIV